jgi:hypothetical protein
MTTKEKSAGEAWLSLEQVSQALGLPWSTVLRWAKAGDPRLPAYQYWDETAPKLGSYRFKQQDLVAYQAAAQTLEETPLSTK